MNSPGDYDNSMEKKYTRVGFGIVPVSNNQKVYLTVMFSTRDFSKYPVNSSEIESLKKSLIDHIVLRSPYIKTESQTLSSDLSEWVNGDRSTSLLTYMSSKGYHFAMDFRTYRAPYSEGLADEFNDSNRFVTTS